MYGYLVPNLKALDKQAREAYRARYCGLCRTIGIRYGNLMRSALSYEMTFAALLLDNMSGSDAPSAPRCIKYPFRRGTSESFVPTASLSFAADLTVLLLAAKYRDDIADEGSRRASVLIRRLVPHEAAARERLPHAAVKITQSLSLLAEMEAHNELNPDLPSGCFGELVGDLLSLTDEEHANALRHFGFALGKLLYLMDATEDLPADLKHERYNPLVLTDSGTREAMLNMLSGDLLDAFARLPQGNLTPLLRNILEEGIWMRFHNPGTIKKASPKEESK